MLWLWQYIWQKLQEKITPPSMARVYRGGGVQPIPSDSWTKVLFDTKLYDERSEFSTAASRFTAKSAGYYVVTTQAMLRSVGSATPPTMIILQIRKNGSEVAGGYHFVPVAGSHYILPVATGLYLDKDDFLEVFIFHTYGVNRFLWYGEGASNFSIHQFPYIDIS